jgi:hypothetical protein
MLRRVLIGLLFSCAIVGGASAQGCGPLPDTLTNGQAADASQVMANFNTILNCINGSAGTSVAVGTTTITSPIGNGPLTSNSGVLGNVTWGQLPGTSTNDSANTGNVGEYITATGSGVALTANVSNNVTSISLTAGDWDVGGVVNYVGNTSTTVLRTESSVSATSLGMGVPASFYGGNVTYFATVNGSGFSVPIPTTRFSLSATTTIYMVVSPIFSGSTMSATGTIRARRMR